MYQGENTLRSGRMRRVERLIGISLVAIAAAGLPGCEDKSPTGTDFPSSSEGAQVSQEIGADSAVTMAPKDATALATIGLPINQSQASAGVLFGLTQTGNGPAGSFKINKTGSVKDALLGQSNGAGGAAVHGIATGGGSAGRFEIVNSASSGTALLVASNGPGSALHANAGVGRAALFNSASAEASVISLNTGTGFAAQFLGFGSAKGVLIETAGGAGLQVVGGSKNAVVRTPAGAKALYTEESTEVWFTDYGFGRLVNGRARVLLDPAFAQTINPDERYHVFLQAHGRGELYVADMTPLGFEVALNDGGDADAEFSYRVVAKRLGFEAKRLEAAPWAD